MKYLENDVAKIHYDDNKALEKSLSTLCLVIKNSPSVLIPVKDADEGVKARLFSEGFELYPTVKKTTLFFDQRTDSYFKILHPLSIKHRILYHLFDRSRAIYELANDLRSRGIKIPAVSAYGQIKSDMRPLFVSARVEGDCLNNIVIKGSNRLAMECYRKVIDEVVKFHRQGFWLGDAHPAHIFVKDGDVAGFIDIDSIRKNRLYRPKNMAKDIAGMNHPGLPLTRDEKKSLLDYYLEKAGIAEREKFIRMLKHYTAHRWE